jgi:CubicO group peptidase (beta-lactamase class C family)
MKKIAFVLCVLLWSCTNNIDEPSVPDETTYFPPLTGTVWETSSVQDLGWNQSNVQDLLDYLEAKNTKGFIILKNGKIVLENYFNGHTQTDNWYWASAAKTLTGLTVGIAQQEGFLNIDDKTSDYLSLNWTNLSLDKENLITVKHQLTMTSGLDDTDFSNTTANHLVYVSDAGTRWAYHNAPYTLLQKVVENATSQTFSTYFNQKIRNKIGMNGVWLPSGFNKIYWSTTRSMARFGLLILNDAQWNSTEILNDATYFTEMTSSSQNLNNSYGYLWWLNGKSSYRLPLSQTVFNGSMIPNAPNDMIMALGKNDQKIYIIPSQRMVVIRMGEIAIDDQLSLSNFDSELWEKINLVTGN